MRRVLSAVRSLDKDAIEDRLKGYNESLVEWNNKIDSYYAKLKIYLVYVYAKRLEDDIHSEFQAAGALLERQVRRRRKDEKLNPGELAAVDRHLLRLAASNTRFGRDLLRAVEERRTQIYFGRRIRYSRDTLSDFSTWQLFQALFIRDIDSHAIVRSAVDSG
jgi:hypothetical protein